jgi:hypothetical protein
MGKSIGKKTAKSIRKTAKGGFSDYDKRTAFIEKQLRLADTAAAGGRGGQAKKIRDAIKKQFGVDYEGYQYTTEPEPGEPSSWLPPKYTQDVLTSKGGENVLMAAMWQDAVQGAEQAEGTLGQRIEDFTADPLNQALQEQAQGLLDDPDVFSADDISRMQGMSDARLSQSYQNQSAGLQHALGGRGIDPSSGVAQELAAGLRFGTLQQGAMNANEIQMNASMMNRSALEDAMRLGISTSGFMQGTQNELAALLGNFQARQPLANVGLNAASLAAANNFQAPRQDSIWKQAGHEFLTGTAKGAGAAGGAALAGLF